MPSLDSQEDAKDQGLHTFSHTHMRKAFRLMNDLRRLVLIYQLVIQVATMDSDGDTSPLTLRSTDMEWEKRSKIPIKKKNIAKCNSISSLYEVGYTSISRFVRIQYTHIGRNALYSIS